MTWRLRQIIRVGVLALAVPGSIGLTACGGDTSTADSYRYDSDQAGVDVDSPALRAQKQQAGIPDCPKVPSGAGQRDGGLPSITLPCLGGGRDVNLAGLTGRPTVLNFWAQTCSPCRQESPLFQRLHEDGKVRVLGVNFYDPLPGRAIAFADELGLTYPQLADPEAVTRAPMRIQGLPMTVFVSADGTVEHVAYGAVESTTELRNLVKTYLGVDVDLG